MTPSSAMPHFKRSPTPLSSALLVRPKSEILFEIFDGTLGRVHLGRMLSGTGAGRLVLLRELAGPPTPEFEAEVGRVKAIAHPRLAKTLGVFRAAETWQLASEFIPGVTLFELTQRLASHGERMDSAVAARVMLDALQGLIAARALLPHTATTPCVFAESIWIADFGETFLAEVSSSALLAHAALADAEDERGGAEDRDLRAAGRLLLELACGSTEASALEDPLIPAALREVIARATGMARAPRFSSLAAFVGALSALDGGLASDEAVSEELHRLMGSVLQIRRQKLAMAERGAAQPSEQDETKFFRAAARNQQQDTARPPPRRISKIPAEAEVIPTPTLPVAGRSEPPEDPTMVFRRPNLEEAASGAEPATAAQSDSARSETARDEDVSEAAWVPSASQAPLDLAPPALDFAPHATRAPRIALLLVLLLAGVAFVVGSSATRAKSKGSASAQPGWVQAEFAKLRQLF